MAEEVVHLGDRRQRSRVVFTFPLPAGAKRRLIEVLGAQVELVEIKSPDCSEEIVLVPASSQQLTGKLRAAFPAAALLVVEVEDVAHGVRLGGQVLRSLDAGAEGYSVARSVDELASIVDRAAGQRTTAESQEPAALRSGADDEMSAVLDALLQERQRTRSASTDP